MLRPAATWDVYQAAFKTLVSTVDGVERHAVPWPEWAITTVVDCRGVSSIVWRAVQCHVSQMSVYERLRGLTEAQLDTLWGRQCFYRAFSTVNGGRRVESDLFDGIRR